MPDIKISVKNKVAIRTNDTSYICGNSDFIVKFDFDTEWETYDTKTARFSYDGRYIDVIFTGSECKIPVISDIYVFYVGVYAGNLHTTTPARVSCRKSILCGGGIPADPTPDVYAQIMERLNNMGGSGGDEGSGGTGSGIESIEIEVVGYDDSDDSGSSGNIAGKDGVGITNITITEE